MANELKGKRVAALVDTGFEESELLEPKKALEAAGATVEIISPHQHTVRGWNHGEWGQEVKVDHELDLADPESYDAVLLPGGVMNPDRLRTNEKAVEFVRQTFDDGKPIAAICHGPWTLIEAGAVSGLQMTSWPSLETDLRNAGARWVDEAAVEDRGVVTSRTPDDIPAFNHRMIQTFRQAHFERQAPGLGTPAGKLHL